MKNYYTTQKYIKEFIKKRFKTNDKYLSELSYKFITDFEYYLRNRTPERGQKPLNNNGLMKHIERFCKMVNLAVRLEWLDRNPFHAYQLRFEKVERHLTPANLIEKSGNNIWISTNRQKTNEPVKVPLLPKALAIVEKYKDYPQALAEGKVLPAAGDYRQYG